MMIFLIKIVFLISKGLSLIIKEAAKRHFLHFGRKKAARRGKFEIDLI